MKLLLVLVLMVIIPAVVEPATKQPYIWERATGASAVDLRGKMFTLPQSYGGITFYPPNYHFSSTPYPTRRETVRSWTTVVPATSRPYTFSTRAWTASSDLTTTRRWTPTYPWTTGSPTRGVSVCLRYMTDQSYFQLFTLSPDRSPLKVEVNPNLYRLTFNTYYNYVNLQPLIMFWPNTDSDFWTSVCITVDTRTGVAQLFSGRNMSIRKVLSSQYVWSGEPVIDFSGFDGQLTDVQVWDYPLRYKEIFYYMNRGYYGSYSGSVLSWSYISYSPRGRALMEESYSMQAKKPIRKVAQERGLKRERLKKKKKLLI